MTAVWSLSGRRKRVGMGLCVSTPDRCVGRRLSRKRLKSSPAMTAPVSEGLPGKYTRSVAPDNRTFQGFFFHLCCCKFLNFGVMISFFILEFGSFFGDWFLVIGVFGVFVSNWKNVIGWSWENLNLIGQFKLCFCFCVGKNPFQFFVIVFVGTIWNLCWGLVDRQLANLSNSSLLSSYYHVYIAGDDSNNSTFVGISVVHSFPLRSWQCLSPVIKVCILKCITL